MKEESASVAILIGSLKGICERVRPGRNNRALPDELYFGTR
jgi:hypothetical protein